MGRFDSCYLFSDVDGTLMTSEYTIPQVNIDALRRFTRCKRAKFLAKIIK